MVVRLLADLLAPGVGRSVVDALAFICAAAGDMHESRELCARVGEQLAFVFEKLEAMEAKGTLPGDAVLAKYARAVGDFAAVLEKQQRRPWIYRVVTYKRVLETASSAQDVVGDLMAALSLCHIEAMGDERARMREFRAQQERLIEARLVSDAAVAREVARQAQQLEALSVLRHELQTSAAAGAAESAVVRTALDKVMRRSSVRVASTPEWFLPPHKVEFEPEAFACGSFGSVHHGRMGIVEVVVKCLLLDARGAGEGLGARFRAEAQLWFGFRHRHVLTMYGACDVSSPPYLVCEFAAHGNLFAFLGGGGRGTRRAFTFRLLLEAAAGLLYLHEQRVVHGDLKCDNILVAADGTAKLADFSFSYVRSLSASRASVADPSLGGRPKAGALRWRAPECLRARRPTAASDVFSLGMCIVEAVSLELPWGYHTDDDTVRDQVKSGELPEQPAAMSARAWDLVRRMCSFEPSARLALPAVIQELSELAAAEAAARDPRVSVRSSFRFDAELFDDHHGPHEEKPVARTTAASSSSSSSSDNQRDAVLGGTSQAAAPERAKRGGVAIMEHPSNQETVGEEEDDEDVEGDDDKRDGNSASFEAAAALHRAARLGRVDELRTLLAEGVAVDCADRSGETALVAAAAAGQTDAAHLLLQNGASVATRSRSGVTALHRAAGCGHVATAALLLEKRARVDARTANGHTPLYWAAWKGQADAAALLLEHGADAEARDNGGTSALHQAATQGHADVVTALLAAGVTVDRAAVKLAARHQHEEIVGVLKPRVRSVLSRVFG